MTLQEAYAALSSAQVAYSRARIAEAICSRAYNEVRPEKPALTYVQDPVAFREYLKRDNEASKKAGLDEAIVVRIHAETDLIEAMRALMECNPYTGSRYAVLRPLFARSVYHRDIHAKLIALCASFPVPLCLEVRAC